MEWSANAYVISVRRQREHATLVTLLTDSYGLARGTLPGGQGLRQRPLLQLGNQVGARWRGRLEEQLGYFQLELQQCSTARWLDEPTALAAISSCCQLLDLCCAEKMPMPELYAATRQLLATVQANHWPLAYSLWELQLLAQLGYGLDLQQCCLTGMTGDLTHVSPRTGRAVSRQAGAPYAAKLLPLPAYLQDSTQPPDQAELATGLALTGHFLLRFLQQHRPQASLPTLRAQILASRVQSAA